MKNVLFFVFAFLVSFGTYAQELAADDFVIITQQNAAYPGFNAKTYRGLYPVGHGQFKMFNYGGTPGNLLALGANETLGSFVFNGYDGSQNVISAVIQAKTITDSRDPRFNFLLSNGVGNQRPNRMTIVGQTGNVGIGVTDPTEKLDIDGSIRMRQGAIAGYVPVSDADGKMTWTDPSTLATSPWTDGGSSVYKLNANVGIGTTFPLAPLSIESSGEMINLTSTSSQNYIAFKASGNNIGYVGVGTGNGDMSFGTFASNGIGSTHLVTAGTPKLTITDDGKVGIGTTTPAHLLEIPDTTNAGETSLNVLNNNLSSSTQIIRAEYTGSGLYDATVLYAKATPANLFGYGARIEANWRGMDIIGQATGTNIAITTPNASGITPYGVNVNVVNNSTTAIHAPYGVYSSAVQNTTGNAYGGYFSAIVTGANDTAYGVVGYANSDANEISYGVYADHDPSDVNGYAIYANGVISATGYAQHSDKRFKKDIEPMENALGIIKELQPKTYNYKREGEFAKLNFDEQLQYGFIAQELEEVIPDVVRDIDVVFMDHKNKKGARERGEELVDETYTKKFKGVNYMAIIPVLTQGIKELSSENQELKSSNDDLKIELQDVKKQLSELTELVSTKLSQIEQDMSSCCLNDNSNKMGTVNTDVELDGSDMPSLEQNQPNPFYEQTIIKYYLPSSARTATITITDIKGSPLKSVNLEEKGLGTVTINANELPIGTYIYTLFVDGKRVESRQMILVR